MMLKRLHEVASMLIALGLILGCSGGGPVAPSTTFDTAGSMNTAGSTGNHQTWGLWDVTIDTATGSCDIIPLRTATFTANVNNILEAQPGNLLIEDLDGTGFQTEGRLDCTLKLTHPFPGLDRFNGFDVWGVFLHNGASVLMYDGLIYSGGPDAGDDEAVLLNPDGYTRWFNQPEFDGDGMPLFKYWPGNLSNLPAPTATLNPYRIFADGLDVEDNYYEWISNPGNADDRGVFRAGSVNSRRYELQFPIIGSSPVAHFQYAIIATWELGDPALTGDPLIYDPFDFPTSANCEEAFFIHAATDQSNLYFDESTGLSGGTFRADVEVFDWQGGSVGNHGVPNEIESIIIEGDFVPGGSHQFMQAELVMIASSGTANSSVFQVEISDCSPQAGDEAELWVIVESAGLNGESYYQGFPDVPYPVGARRSAFLPGTVTVSGEPPLDVIYVDDSNTSGIEDGTQAHPYNTIQEGIDSTPGGFEIWVDDSGNAYEEQVIMKSDAIVRSRNWDTSDGTNRAFIDGPEDPETHSVYFYDVSDAILDGFQIGFAGPWSFLDMTEMIRIDGGSNITVQDCLFTGQTDRHTVYPIAIFGTVDVTIANCRMADIDRGASSYGCRTFCGIYAENCPGIIVRNNIFTNIRSTEDSSSKNIDICVIIDSPNAIVRNNLIHHIIPHAGVGDMGAVLMKGFYFDGCSGVVVANNTVDSMDTTDAYSIQQVMCFYFDGCSDVAFTDNIASHIYSAHWPTEMARGVQAISGDVWCDYTDIYDVAAPFFTCPAGSAHEGVGCIFSDPDYIDPDTEQYDISAVSSARFGDPSFVDWDDTGAPSNNPDDYDPNTRSRMGCHGGPGGEIVGLLTPE